jgi:lipoprotein-anchoring transpeptidase ErfK/SrfK
MERIRRAWQVGLVAMSGTCLILTGCQGLPATINPVPSARSASKRAVTASLPAETPASDGSPNSTTIALQNGGVYGVGMPVVVDFSAPVPDAAKEGVEHGLSVRSDPAQAGAWRWYGDQEVIYRPQDFWRPGTKLTVNAADGHASATIGRKTTFQTSDATKQMQVFQNDKLVKTFPVSLGSPDTPSSTGHMVIMTREAEALWVYSADDQLDVKFAERLTGDGEYIHAAPWSVDDQGRDDVSHGCTNLSTDNAQWVYDNSEVGDPVTVSGTGKHLEPGNGWTVWDMTWSDYVKGSVAKQQAQPPPLKK